MASWQAWLARELPGRPGPQCAASGRTRRPARRCGDARLRARVRALALLRRSRRVGVGGTGQRRQLGTPGARSRRVPLRRRQARCGVRSMRAENVWDYPRPPAVTSCRDRVRVEVAGEVLAESTNALRVLETSHPPTVYVPPDDVRAELLTASGARSTWCEFKGVAHYLDAVVGG